MPRQTAKHKCSVDLFMHVRAIRVNSRGGRAQEGNEGKKYKEYTSGRGMFYRHLYQHYQGL